MDRSAIMRAVRSKDTAPEHIVRRLAYTLGYRFRLHRADLPGKPDLTFAGRRSVIFVNGCFWHGHQCTRGARIPKTNREYWIAKIGRNVVRDKTNIAQLKKAGWRTLILWECELKDAQKLAGRLNRFLGAKQRT